VIHATTRRWGALLGIVLAATLPPAATSGCAPCYGQIEVIVRLAPDNPDGSPPPPFDPRAVSAAECEELCGLGTSSCVAVVLAGDIPAARCVWPGNCELDP
jgi:hypothetical protein